MFQQTTLIGYVGNVMVDQERSMLAVEKLLREIEVFDSAWFVEIGGNFARLEIAALKAGLFDAVCKRVCEQLPSTHHVEVWLEKGRGEVSLVDQAGSVVFVSVDGLLAHRLEECVDACRG